MTKQLRAKTFCIMIENGETPQALIEKGIWFAAAVNDTSSYTLVGCTVAPGFDFSDFDSFQNFLLRT